MGSQMGSGMGLNLLRCFGMVSCTRSTSGLVRTGGDWEEGTILEGSGEGMGKVNWLEGTLEWAGGWAYVRSEE